MTENNSETTRNDQVRPENEPKAEDECGEWRWSSSGRRGNAVHVSLCLILCLCLISLS